MNKKTKPTTTPAVSVQTEAPAPPAPEMTYGQVSVDLIDPNPQQPRVDFSEAELAELAGSIKENGLIQPIVVQALLSTGRYILHDGERRLRASKLAGLERVPANIILSDIQDPQTLLIRAIVANDQRVDLSPIERARGYQKLADEHGLSDSQIATQTGKSRSLVANTRRLLGLPAERQQQVASGELSERSALALLPLYALPKAAQEKMLSTYYGKELLKPEKLTSDDIRRKYNDGLSYISHEITFDPNEGFAGDGIHQATCVGCEFYAKIKEESRCVNDPCLDAKTNIIKRNYIADAAAKLGLPYVDPDKWRGIQASQSSGLYSSDTLSLALENNCPKLHLVYSPYGSSPEGFNEACYVCLHQAKGCDCRKAIEAKEKAKEKGAKQEVRQVKDKAIVHVTKLIQDNHPEILRAILYTMIGNWNEPERALTLLPEKVMVELAKKMIEGNANPSEYRLATNEENINGWLAKMGLPTMDTAAKAAYRDRRLARIEGWIADHPERPPVEQIKADLDTLTNLAELAEELARAGEAPALTTRFDEAKKTLLVWLQQVENVAVASMSIPEQQAQAGATWTRIKPTGSWSCKGCLTYHPEQSGWDAWVRDSSKPDESILCNKCRTKLPAASPSSEPFGLTWREIPFTGETCGLCGRHAKHHLLDASAGASFHLCEHCYQRYTVSVTGHASVDTLKAVWLVLVEGMKLKLSAEPEPALEEAAA